jgi:hypothetical protein
MLELTIPAPGIVELPTQRMAVLESFSDPALVGNPTVRKLFAEVAPVGAPPAGLRAR